jgi:iron complex transport system permease protein
VPATASTTAVAARAPQTPPLATSGARAAGLLAAVLLLVLCAATSLAIGSRSVPLREVVTALVAPDGSDSHAIVRDLRVPRTLLGLLVGGALGAAGALMQGVTRNPLAEPGILGVNAGAAFAVVLWIQVVGLGSVTVYAAVALVGAAASAVLVFVLGGTARGGPTPVRLALAGAVLTALLTSLTSAVLVFSATTLDEFRFWAVGSLAGRDPGVALGVLPVLGAGFAIALASGRSLNALALGNDVARGLGQDVTRARLVAGTAFVLLAGGAVAAAGPIAFVGLAVPHLARGVVGPDYRWVVPYSVVLGGALLLGADVIGRVLAPPGEVQVGVVAAFVGAPVFLWLVRRRRLVTL